MSGEQSSALEIAYRECVHQLYALAFQKWCFRSPEEMSNLTLEEIVRRLEMGLKKAEDMKTFITNERRKEHGTTST